MNDVRTPNNPGQNTHPSSASPLDPSELLVELRAFQRDFERALPRLRAAADRIEAKLRASGLGVAVMAEPPTPQPAFAVHSDGRTLLSMDALGGRDLGEREEWTGVVLSALDVAFVMGRLDNAAHETACHLVTQYPKVSTRTSEQPSREDDGENDGENEEHESEDNEDGSNE